MFVMAKQIKELFASTLNGIAASVRCVSSIIVVLNSGSFVKVSVLVHIYNSLNKPCLNMELSTLLVTRSIIYFQLVDIIGAALKSLASSGLLRTCDLTRVRF